MIQKIEGVKNGYRLQFSDPATQSTTDDLKDLMKSYPNFKAIVCNMNTYRMFGDIPKTVRKTIPDLEFYIV